LGGSVRKKEQVVYFEREDVIFSWHSLFDQICLLISAAIILSFRI